MAGKKQIIQIVNLKDIVVEEKIYPRTNTSWQKAYEYSQAMQMGREFPKIILALHLGKLYLIDGNHRKMAMKMNKVEQTEAIVYTGMSFPEMFKMAIQLNVAHGLGLTPYDKRRAIVRLMEMNVTSQEISSLLNVVEDKLQTFVEQRMVNSLTGLPSDPETSSEDYQKIANNILKSSMKHMVGSSGDEAEQAIKVQKKLWTNNQLHLWKDLVYILENNLVDTTNPEIVKLISKVKTLIQKV